MSEKFVYDFKEGNASMRELLGGKGANLAEMTNMGLPVPQGFTVTTAACTKYYEDGEKISDEIIEEIEEHLKRLEELSGKKFGDPTNPLLVSVRSGARASMPGMMDTILNLGLNVEVVVGFANKTQNERFALDSYRRFIQMFSDVVMELSKKAFEDIIDEKKKEKSVEKDTDLDAQDLKDIIVKFKEYYRQQKGEEFPDSPKEQLIAAVKAVFRSWNNERAIYYRRMNDIPASWGTAVNVQMMVFGNMGDTSGTGVAFTRNAATGENKLFGEFLMNAQGEDVVAGIRTPQPIAELEKTMPNVYAEFLRICKTLEDHYKDMQDMEFTIEEGKLFMLQTRNGKRTPAAALKIACDLVEEGKIDRKKAVSMIDPRSLDALLHPQFDAKILKEKEKVATGLAASPGAASGKVVFTAQDAIQSARDGEKVILVRLETSPEDIEGMDLAQGILTVRGGMTSHAAVVARGMGKCCVCGCGEIEINEQENCMIIAGKRYNKGDYISIDGSTGNVYGEKIPTVEAQISGYFEKIMNWADEFKRLDIRTNADTPKDAKVAVNFGACGVGLCRTEHMFFEADRIKAMREMILSKTKEQRETALKKLLPMQQRDFEGIFEALNGMPVTIRFLDPPLHEFLPQEEKEQKELAQELGISLEEVKATISSLHEFNPMMGHRGCRLAVTYPEIAVMQTKAVINAAINVKKAHNDWDIVPEIMIPLVGEIKELQYVKSVVVKTADELIKNEGVNLKYKVGTMIEIPRAALTADEIAKDAEFFSFGTNDLTQMTFGFSRDDASKFLDSYYKKSIYEQDPFARLDKKGVFKLVSMAVEMGRKTRKDLKVGICGEHGGDPSSIELCEKAGLDYVSCSPFRVPIARLAAAQAAILNS